MLKRNLFLCPDCLTPVFFNRGKAKCVGCQREFQVKEGVYILLPSVLSKNKIKEDEIYTLDNLDNAWYNNRVWYYFIHLSSHVVRFEKELLPKIKGPRVLELACGSGWASILIKRSHPEYEVYASDVSFRSLDIQGKQMADIMEKKPDYFLACDAEKLPFKDNYFDTVFVVASLHHFLNIGKALREAKRVLKPGGILLAFDGMMPKFASKVLKSEESERAKKFGILEKQITYDDWKDYLEKAGIPEKNLRLNYDSSYLHSYATNSDEEKIIKKRWWFNALKEIIYGGFLLKMNQDFIKLLKLTYIFPAGVIIHYQKK